MVKHLLTLAAATALSISNVHAQDSNDDLEIAQQTEKPKPATRKGNLAIGSSIGLANVYYGWDWYGAEDRWSYDVRLTPTVSYFFSNHWMISANLNLGISQGTYQTYPTRFRNYSGSLGLSARYYFGKATNTNGEINKLRFYAEAGAGYAHAWERVSEVNGPNYSYNWGDAMLNGGLGASYFANPNLAFEAGLNYTRMLEIDNFSPRRGSVQFQMGMRFFLNRK